jgi:hypothetical protein
MSTSGLLWQTIARIVGISSTQTLASSENVCYTRGEEVAIQSLLDVIINQNQFFATSEQRFGTIIHRSDENELLLTVDANSQQKEVRLASRPTAKDTIDTQTTHVFTIERFLLAYHPLYAVFYAPNSDPDGESGN